MFCLGLFQQLESTEALDLIVIIRTFSVNSPFVSALAEPPFVDGHQSAVLNLALEFYILISLGLMETSCLISFLAVRSHSASALGVLSLAYAHSSPESISTGTLDYSLTL